MDVCMKVCALLNDKEAKGTLVVVVCLVLQVRSPKSVYEFYSRYSWNQPLWKEREGRGLDRWSS